MPQPRGSYGVYVAITGSTGACGCYGFFLGLMPWSHHHVRLSRKRQTWNRVGCASCDVNVPCASYGVYVAITGSTGACGCYGFFLALMPCHTVTQSCPLRARHGIEWDVPVVMYMYISWQLRSLRGNYGVYGGMWLLRVLSGAYAKVAPSRKAVPYKSRARKLSRNGV